METRSKKRQKTKVISVQAKPKSSIVQDSKDDTTKLLSVFPEEVWNLILINLNTATDFQNTSNSSKLFANLLQPLRMYVLFSSVFKLMFETFVESHSILKLRRVCRSWKRDVDHTLQNLDGTFQFKSDITFCISSVSYERVHRKFSPVFKHIGKITAFEQRFAGTRSNPFVTRHLFVEIYKNLELYCERLEEMLKNYGTHVWYLDIDLRLVSFTQQMDFYKSLIRMFAFLSNLKHLRIITQSCHYFGKLDLIHFQNYLRNFPVPTLHKLQSVYLCKLHPVFYKAILVNNRQITSVQTGGRDDVETQNAAVKMLPNLQNFSAYARNLVELETTIPTKSNCSLVKLTLILHNMVWSSIFEILEKGCAGTLEELKIALPVTGHSAEKQSLNLPKLKKLAVRVMITQTIEFIKPMKHHLEELSVTVHDNDRERLEAWVTKEVNQVAEHKQTDEPTNVWAHLPKLQRLILQGETTTRNKCK